MYIKFRGKCLKSGNWYYGGYAESFFDGNCVYSIVVYGEDGFKRIPVSKESVGQFTGLHDCNGIEIYAGDKVQDHVGLGVVKYSDKHGAFRVSYGDGFAKWFYDYILNGERESIQVIGNIHE